MNKKKKLGIFSLSFILIAFISLAINALDNYGKISLSKTATKKDNRTADVSLKIDANNLKTTTVDLVLVLDRSSSMNDYMNNERKMVVAKKAAKGFVNALLPEGNSNFVRMGVVAYGTNVSSNYSSSSLTNNKQTILNTIDSISDTSSNQGTNIQLGLKKAGELLNKSTATNKIIILISDGAATYFTHDDGTSTRLCGTGGNDNYANSPCPHKRPSEAAKEQATALKAAGQNNEIYTIGFGDKESEIKQFLSQDIATSPNHYYPATNTAALNNTFGDIARKIKGTIAKDAVVKDIIPVGFRITESSKQNLINKFGSTNVEFTTNSANETVMTIKINEINANFGTQSIDYQVVADEDHYGSMYTNTEATLKATATEFNTYYDEYDKKIDLTFAKPAVGMEMVTRDDDYTATPVKEGESISITAENGILKNDSQIKHEEVPTGSLNVSVTDKIIISKQPKCGNVIVNNDGSFTYYANGKCRGDVTFEYYVQSDVTIDMTNTKLESNKSIVTMRVALNETSYIVKYLEKNTDKQLSTQKTESGYAYNEIEETAINIDGYKLVGENKQKLTLDKDASKNIIIFYYEREKAELKDPTIEKTGPDKITASDQLVDYVINYKTEIDKYIGEATITIVDQLPYEINKDLSQLDGGSYNKENKTITWVLKYDVNTYKEINNVINVTKNIKISYIYPEFNGTEETVMNQVAGNTHVETAVDKQVRDTEYTDIDIKGTLIEKHVYINKDNVEEDLIPAVTTSKKIGTTYTTSKKEIPGYQIKTIPTNKDGKYEERTITVKYIYDKVPASIKDPEISKTSKLTSVDSRSDVVSYRVFYKATIKDYRGKAQVTIVDTLPYHIDQSKSNLAEGTYENSTKTITWTFDIEDIDTFANGDKVVNIPIEFSVLYTDLDAKADSMTNHVTGTIKVDTAPDNTVESEVDTKININGDVVVRHIDTEGTLLLSESTTSGKVGTKYTTSAQTIPGYQLVTTPSNANGEYAETKTIVTYVYNRLPATPDDTVLTKTGTTKITASNETFNYNISYSAVITDYKGDLTLTLTDKLPYEIDESKTDISKLDGGVYNKANKTITWTLEYKDIDPTRGLTIDVNKKFNLVYKNLNPTSETVINEINAVLMDDLNNKADEKNAEHSTAVDIKGNVITKFVDQEMQEIAEQNNTNGKVGTPYTTEPKDITGYENPVLIQGAASGNYIEGTITVIYKYSKKPARITDESITKNSRISKVEASNTKVDYQISYTGKLDDYRGTATFKIVDYLPYEIDKDNSELAGGTYSKEKKTITWEVVQNNIDTYKDGTYLISVQKSIVLKYINMDSKKDIVNKVVGETITQTGSSDPKVEAEKVIEASIKGKLIVEHVYIDENGIETMLDKETKTDYVGESYTTKHKEFDGYKVKDENPEHKNGNYIEGTTTVRYVYDRVPAIIEKSELIKIAGNDIIESVKDSFEYTIKYATKIKDYIGKAIITIVDYLSYEIDELKSSLAGGTYSKENKTITWKYNYDVNSYEGKNSDIFIQNNINLLYLNLDPTQREVLNTVYSKLEVETADPTENDDEAITDLAIKGNVIVKFQDKDGNVLAEQIIMTGLVGEDYQTSAEEILGYNLIEVIGDEEGQYIDGETVVTYVYDKEPENIIEPPKTGINNNNNSLPFLLLCLSATLVIMRRKGF